MGYDETLDGIEISTRDLSDFRVRMIQYLREHHAEVLGDDLKLLLLPLGIEMLLGRRPKVAQASGPRLSQKPLLARRLEPSRAPAKAVAAARPLAAPRRSAQNPLRKAA